jgi:hypothetical protein
MTYRTDLGTLPIYETRDRLLVTGYSPKEASDGIAWAIEQGAVTQDELLDLAVTRILYDDDQIANGARWGA